MTPTTRKTFERMKIALHKGFYYYFNVIHFWSLFAFLLKKLKKLRWFFEKKIRISSLREIFPIGAFLRRAAD